MSFSVGVLALEDFSDGPAHGHGRGHPSGPASCGCLSEAASVARVPFIFELVEGTALLRSQLFRSHLKVSGTFT